MQPLRAKLPNWERGLILINYYYNQLLLILTWDIWDVTDWGNLLLKEVMKESCKDWSKKVRKHSSDMKSSKTSMIVTNQVNLDK